MLILWMNAVAAAGATTIWLLVARSWLREGKPSMAGAYALAAAGSGLLASGFILAIFSDPSASAWFARQWAWLALLAPAVARLGELIHGERLRHRVGGLLARAELREEIQERRSSERRAAEESA